MDELAKKREERFLRQACEWLTEHLCLDCEGTGKVPHGPDEVVCDACDGTGVFCWDPSDDVEVPF